MQGQHLIFPTSLLPLTQALVRLRPFVSGSSLRGWRSLSEGLGMERGFGDLGNLPFLDAVGATTSQLVWPPSSSMQFSDFVEADVDVGPVHPSKNRLLLPQRGSLAYHLLTPMLRSSLRLRSRGQRLEWCHSDLGNLQILGASGTNTSHLVGVPLLRSAGPGSQRGCLCARWRSSASNMQRLSCPTLCW